MRNFTWLVLALAFTGGVTACGDGDGDGDGVLIPDGSITPVGGGTAPGDGVVYVFWLNDTGDGDFAFKHGEGTADGTAFSLDVVEPVPSGALLDGQFGLGFIVLFAASVDVPDGVVADEAIIEEQARGAAGEFSLIFKTADAPAVGDWPDDFPVGLSCGKCVRASEGFDSYEPVACSAVVIQAGSQDAISTCNAT